MGFANGYEIKSTTHNVTNNAYQYDNNGFPITMNTDGDSHYKSMVLKY